LFKLGVFKAVAFGATYGFIEFYWINGTGTNGNSPVAEVYYRPLYILLMVLPFLGRNLWQMAAESLLAITVQDCSYWLFYFLWGRGPPEQWAVYYPVYYHIPLLYFISVPAILLLYRRARRSGTGEPEPRRDSKKKMDQRHDFG
jgi:hypothetical protein